MKDFDNCFLEVTWLDLVCGAKGEMGKEKQMASIRVHTSECLNETTFKMKHLLRETIWNKVPLKR